MTFLGLDGKTTVKKPVDVTLNTKDGVGGITIVVPSTYAFEFKIPNTLTQEKVNEIIFNEGTSSEAIENELLGSLYKGIFDYVETARIDCETGKKIRAVASTYGMLTHEAVMFIYMNDANFDWIFLNERMLDLPETHSVVPTETRFKDSMEWISRTIDAIDKNISYALYLPVNHHKYMDELKKVFQLVCAEKAMAYGFDLGFDFKNAEYLKTISIKKLKVPNSRTQARNEQLKP
jgi:hypothetical protein